MIDVIWPSIISHHTNKVLCQQCLHSFCSREDSIDGLNVLLWGSCSHLLATISMSCQVQSAPFLHLHYMAFRQWSSCILTLITVTSETHVTPICVLVLSCQMWKNIVWITLSTVIGICDFILMMLLKNS
jgi:hypothetical protein